MAKKIKVLFSDLGGVLLTNGWDHKSRAKAVAKFGLDEKDYESRHQLLFGDYEIGKIDLETYLHYAIFYKPRSFTMKAFVDFMYEQSQPFLDMIEMVKRLKKEYDLRLVVISNEGKELTKHRIDKFGLRDLVDFFIVSCFIGTRKPDRGVWKLALDMVQTAPDETAYIDDRQLFVDIANEMGINAFCHKDLAKTQTNLEALFD